MKLAKEVRSFFDHRRAHEDVRDLWNILFLTLMGTLLPFFLVAPVASTVACALLAALSLGLRTANMTIYGALAYGLGILVLAALKPSLPGGGWSHEFFATAWAVFAICKSFRLKKYGDGQILLILTLASNACVLLLDDSVTVTVWSTVMAVIIVGQLLRLNIKDVSTVTLLASLKSAALMTVYALPLLIFLFFIFHKATSLRINWREGAGTAVTGLSDSLEPGQVSQLTLNTRPAFRVKFDRELPPLTSMYWRATTLTDSRGMQWKGEPGAEKLSYSNLLGNHSCLLSQSIYVPPGTPLFFKVGLDRPTPFSARDSNPYSVTSRLCDWQDHLSKEESQQDLNTHFNPSPRLLSLVTQIKTNAHTPDKIADEIMTYFKTEGFKYTLTPGRRFVRLTLDHFLFEMKSGFCEHFAAATASLLRLSGVPARVVVGFQGGEYNSIGGYWLVSYADAHAWTEMWTDDRGWVRLDPAAILMPQKISGSQDLIKWTQKVADAFFFEIGSFFNNREKILSLSDLTFDSWLALFCLALLFAALQFKKWLRPPDQVLNEDFNKLCGLLGERGLSRKRSEGFEAYRQRVAQWLASFPDLKKVASEIDSLFSFYISYRYGRHRFTPTEIKEAGRAFQNVEKKLRFKTTPLLKWLRPA